MDERRALDILSGRRKGPAAAALRAGLLAASVPYAAAMVLRRWAYRRGVLPSRAADAPVLCVGNLTTGGTGKTPMVAWVTRRLARMGRAPAILTRGYKAAGGTSDEAELLKELTGAPVIVNADRAAGAAQATAGGADVLVMDDGFQHLRLRRQLNIVLIDATNPFGYGHCLPRGLLREPPAVLADAHAVVITRCDMASAESLLALRRRLQTLAPGASLHAARHRPAAFIDEQGGRHDLTELAGRKVCAFCGIANPESFFRTLADLNVRVVRRTEFEDHAAYTPADIDRLCGGEHECVAELMVTTRKDAIKLDLAELRRPVWRLAVEMDVVDGRDELLAAIASAAGRGQAASGGERSDQP